LPIINKIILFIEIEVF